MTNENSQNIHPVRNEDSNGTEEEIQELEGRLKTLKEQSQGDKRNPYMIPGAILIAGIFVAGAVFYSAGNSSNSKTASVGNNFPQQAPPPSFGGGSSDNIKPVSPQDHIKGDPNAPVKVVEFSDTECPFCKRFHPTMQQAVEEYDGQVAWIYRHFPLDSIHSKARREAAATELAAELGGNDKFWAYLDKLFDVTPSNDRLDLQQLVQIAQDVGLPTQPFQDLVAENDIRGGKYADHIEADYQDSLASGGTGTPYSVVIAPNGKTFTVSGAQPYASVKSIIELALKERQ